MLLSRSPSEGNSDMQSILDMLQQLLKLQGVTAPVSPKLPLQAFPATLPSAPLEEDFPLPPPPAPLPLFGRVFSIPFPPIGEEEGDKVKGDFEELDLFPITRVPFAPNAQFPNGSNNVHFAALQFKFLKEMKTAISNHGPQSPFVLSLLDSFSSENLMIPIDWETLGKAVLDRSQWLQL